MGTVQRFEKETSSTSSIYKLITANGFKRVLALILLISFVNTFYIIFYKLSENSLNGLVSKFALKLQSLPYLNETKNM